MRWSLKLMIVGVLIVAVGFLPFFFAGVTVGTLEGGTSLFFVGLLVFLIGFLMRRVRKAFEPAGRGS